MKLFFILSGDTLNDAMLRVLNESQTVLRCDKKMKRYALELDICAERQPDTSVKWGRTGFSISADKTTLYWGLQWIGSISHKLDSGEVGLSLYLNQMAPGCFEQYNALCRVKLPLHGDTFFSNKAMRGSVPVTETKKMDISSQTTTISLA